VTENQEIWILVALAVIGTAIWRALGVLISDRLPQQNSVFLEWIDAVAYAMVSGVMLLIIVFPSGLMSSTELSWRLAALTASLTVMILTGRMMLAVLAGVGIFGLALTFLG
jgi:branched-subunit amino acid transport protein